MIGCAAAIAKAGSGKVFHQPYPTASLGLLLAGFLAYGTWTRNPAWQSDLALWTSAVQTVPNSFKAHSSFAEALYQADPHRLRLAEAQPQSIEALRFSKRFPTIAERSACTDRPPGTTSNRRTLSVSAARPPRLTASYRRSAALLERYLGLLGKPPAYDVERADGERMLSAALLQLADGAGAVDASRHALEREPFNAANYRVAAAALIQARQFDEAAVTLTVGVIVTGNSRAAGRVR